MMDHELHVELALHVQHREQALTAIFASAERHAVDQGCAPTGSRRWATPATSPTSSTSCPSTTTTCRRASGRPVRCGRASTPVSTSAASTGTDLVAVGDGTVTEVAYAGPYGIRTILTLEDGTEIWYCHQLTPLVYEGQAIEIGEPIGLVGSTGNSTGPHLHLEVRPDGGAPIDPAAWLAGHGMAP